MRAVRLPVKAFTLLGVFISKKKALLEGLFSYAICVRTAYCQNTVKYEKGGTFILCSKSMHFILEIINYFWSE
ncbi:hypothetical protein JDS88_21940 [Bacillus cereus]|nr:hypothetical protein [Bacillus cereus]